MSCGGELFLSQSMISKVEMAKPVVSLEQALPLVANIEEYSDTIKTGNETPSGGIVQQ